MQSLWAFPVLVFLQFTPTVKKHEHVPCKGLVTCLGWIPALSSEVEDPDAP